MPGNRPLPEISLPAGPAMSVPRLVVGLTKPGGVDIEQSVDCEASEDTPAEQARPFWRSTLRLEAVAAGAPWANIPIASFKGEACMRDSSQDPKLYYFEASSRRKAILIFDPGYEGAHGSGRGEI